MKLFTSLAALSCAAALLVAIPTSPAAADSIADTLKVTPSGPQFVGDKVDLAANFSASNKKRASLQSDGNGNGPWAKVSGFTGKVLNSYGNYTFKGLTLTQFQHVRVMVDSGSSPEVTEEVTLDPQPLVIGVSGSDGTLTSPAAGSYLAGDPVQLTADFSDGSKKVTMWTDGGTDTWAKLGSASNDQTTSSSGDKTFTVAAAPMKLQVRSSTGLLTNIVELAPTAATAQPPVFSADGKTVTAIFDQPRNGRQALLEVQGIVTTETNETDPTNRPCKQLDSGPGLPTCLGPWTTRATSTQSSTGTATFKISSPYLVPHAYRVRSGEAVSAPVTPAGIVLPAKNTGLPQVYFNTNEGATVDTRTRNFEGQFSMTTGGNLPECNLVAPNSNSTMKGRGNYSWSFKKKGYTLKLGKKTDLCGMGKSKKWALIANHYDKSLMRNQVALNLGSKFSSLWTPKAKPVDFYMNGSYLGTYMLVERVSIQGASDGAPRLDIDELSSPGQTTDPSNANNLAPNITGGYVMEWDFRKGADRNIAVNSHGYVGLKDPEDDRDREGRLTTEGVSNQQVNYIRGYLDDADNALYGSKFSDPTNGWRKYIDEASAVDYFIAMEFLKPIDGNMWASVYMYKPRNEKIKFGPLWDFDLGLGSANRAGGAVSPTGWYLSNVIKISAKQSTTTWFNRLNQDPSFRSAVKARWNQVYPTLSSSSFIDQERSIMSASAAENFKRWSYSERISSVQVFKGSWSKDVDYVKAWMAQRRSWLNAQWG